jgi:glutamate 5-kinase
MATKLAAARIATSAGVEMAITRGRQPSNILKIMAGEAIGTRFEAQKRSDNARKRWIAYGLMPMGKIYLDAGAIQAICQGGKSLLAAGITKVAGEFSASESVQLCDQEGRELARGIVNYSSEEIDRVKGQHSERIASLLGYMAAETIIHRDNLVVLSASSTTSTNKR